MSAPQELRVIPSSEATVGSFWVARRIGGRFKTLILAQLIMLPIGALLVPLVFNLMESTYGIGTDTGQLSAPTGLKIASLALVMEKGSAALPYGALTASLIAIMIGIGLELLLAMRRRDPESKLVHDEHGNEVARFPWLLVPSAFGFALILPPSLTIAIALGSVISAAWKSFSPGLTGSFSYFARPLAAGLIAGEAIVGAILIPTLGVILELLKPYL